ncbi:MAG: MBL fold metallo-hydrolase [Acidobacteria bacterium]|nr:MBL fold metallo-hydrolase [Acidobacteriota bacterium]
MKLIVLGSGTSVPHAKRSSSAYWVESSGRTLLMDCSTSAITRILAEGLDWITLDSIWISHFHLDHCGGLAPFLAGAKHSSEMKKRTKPLRIFGAEGLRKLLDGFNEVNNYKLFEQPFPLEIVEIESLEKFEIAPGLEAVAMSTPHTDESHAIHLRDAEGATLVYTADTGFTETLSAFARHVDLLVIDASFPKSKPSEKHLEFSEAMYVIRKAEPNRAVVTHLYPEWDGVDFERELENFSVPCEVIQALDGLALNIRNSEERKAKNV